jgi:S-adenosylmethionine-diacylglycerol 3-amino-3-carboxypropyl transferase
MTSLALRRAVHRSPATSASGLLERLFTLWFQRLVYTQIWEDPRVDRAALALTPGSRVVAIGSAGCNSLAYLADDPASIDVVDLNAAHLALTRLKLAAVRNLPDHTTAVRFLAAADDPGNPDLYRRRIAPHLDQTTRTFWEHRRPIGGARIELFARGLHRRGASGRFIEILHRLCRYQGYRPERILDAVDLDQQRRIFEEEMAPVFDTALARLICRLPVSFFSLGIPPAQYAALVRESDASIVEVWRSRIERLATAFPIADNPFAWIAFGGRYDLDAMQAVPEFLEPDRYESIRSRTARVTTHAGSLTAFLAAQPAAAFDRYVLLDAQDWMTPDQLQQLWRQIWRTARAGTRVIFRTAAAASPLEGTLPAALTKPWRYDAEASRRLHAADRSAIYGGFHLYHWAA